MGDPTKVFFLEPTKLYTRALRRVTKRFDQECKRPSPFRYCYAKVQAGSVTADTHPTGGQIEWPRDDARWPVECCQCGERFRSDDLWLVDYDRVYRRHDTGDEYTLRSAPPGACWDAPWMREHAVGPDGRTLVVRLPDHHDWIIDSRASNCTLPGDNEHRCWVRHGRPEDGTLHVDKNGLTCGAGAGSIQTPRWHGFLHHGALTTC